MRAVDIIEKKRRGLVLSKEEQQTLLSGYLSGDIPDYQMSAFLMAVVWHGMAADELAQFTRLMAASGDELSLKEIPGVKVDKHSTGGVGDKTTLILAPLLASVGVPVAKMSGRGLGHTGGTIDKLESIPNFSTELSPEDFIRQVREIGVALAGQTGNLAPADKRIYALRDVTGTVESIPLIASSIMSKKLASGADAIVLDVKVGDGAFMKTLDDAKMLAETMVEIGHLAGRETVAVLSSMEEPLGYAIGNVLEVQEAIATLRNEGPADLTEVCLALGAEMVMLAGKAASVEEATAMLKQSLADGSALQKFRQFVEAQGGDGRIVEDDTLMPKAPVIKTVTAEVNGTVMSLPALRFGEAAMRLGAGRATKDDVINPAVGLVLRVKIGDSVAKGDPLIDIHAADEASASACIEELKQAITVSAHVVEPPKLLLGYVRHEDNHNSGHQRLLRAATRAMEQAYVPYSKFAVGAALELANGEIVIGANIENASYGLTNCAERTAVFRGMMTREGTFDVRAIAVVANAPEPVSPCGACRQVLAEFCRPETPVYLGNLEGQIKQTSVRELLPYAFTPSQMIYANDDEEEN